MGLHEKAWSGLNIVIFGKAPLFAMQLEQSLAKASPTNEVRIDSFEDYDQAYDFCKQRKNIGFFFLSENCGKAGADAVFKQLASHYETKGWPAFGVLLHETGRSISGYQAVLNNKNFIDYQPAQKFMELDSCADALNELWNRFVNAFEAAIIPDKLQDTFRCMVFPDFGPADFHFTERVTNILVSQLNISWVEYVAVRWVHVVSILRSRSPEALRANEALTQITAMAGPLMGCSDLSSITKGTESLCVRVASLVAALNRSRKNDSLELDLQLLSTQSKPGAPALLRKVAAAKDQIVRISIDSEAPLLFERGTG